MAGQPQVNLEYVINILRVRLSEEIYQRAMLEAAYTQQTRQIEQLTRELDEKELKEREQAADQHISQQLETTKPENRRAEWSSPKPGTWNPRTSPKQTDTTTIHPENPQTDATPAITSQTPTDTEQP